MTHQIPTFAPGSVLAGAVPVSELADPWIKMLIYGQNGVGKTTLACQWPKPLLLISFEPARSGGARSVTKVPGVTYLRITGPDQALKLAEELQSDRTFKTHVLDTVTALQELVLQEIMGVTELPTQLNFQAVNGDQYRFRSERTRDVIRPFLNLAAHTVVIAKEKDHNPPKEERVNERTGKVQPDMRPRFLRGIHGGSFFAADLGGATVGWVQDSCDYTCQMTFAKEVKVEVGKVDMGGRTIDTRTETETGRYIRALRCQYHPNYAARFRSANPERVPEFIEEPTFAKILAVIEGK